ncbi:MAG: DNA-binding protein HU [Candidatus Izimaplasma bacterium HR2]|nr:MAG: DNA-binding protein HU [Candidatus Izimaplasma bacterium HR2]
MNKDDLVSYVAEETGTFKKDIKGIVDAVLAGIERGLVVDGKVTLRRFGNFVIKQRASRKARNPQTGETVYVPAKSVPIFKPSENLKEVVK